MLELVAPAGDGESFRAALANGADAIYAGSRSFSARQYAANFDLSELAASVRLAHLHRVRVYVTMNILLRREEIAGALAQARALRDAGADALIVQDLGLLVELRCALPDLRLHGSTQMTVTNAATLGALGRLGVCRVVLAREATEGEIRVMAAAGPEIEVFVHGALCYSYSGQCLMSSLIGGRSGNRGRCAQPCRLEYGLVGSGGTDLAAAAGRYLLSPRDLCLLPYLPRLAAAGVRALKIEGRMKRPEYVGTVVRIYRQALDRLAESSDGFTASPDEERDLEQIFNRGFTPGFFLGDRGLAYQSCQRPNNRGLAIGRVTAVDRAAGRITVALTENVHRDDGLEIWVTRGGRVGTTLAQMTSGGRPLETAAAGQEVTIPLREAVHPGDRVFRTRDARLHERALAPVPPLPFYARIAIAQERPVLLTLTDDEGRSVTVAGELRAQPAVRHPLTEEAVRAQLARTGGTGWSPAEIAVELAPGTMVPISEFNRLRRAGLAALEEARLSAYAPTPCPAPESGDAAKELDFQTPAVGSAAAQARGETMPPRLHATVSGPDEARAALEAGVDRLYLASWLHAWPDRELAALAAVAERRDASLVFALPRVAPEKEIAFWASELGRVKGLGLAGVRLGDLGLAELARADWAGRIHLDFSLNVTNPSTLRSLAGCAATVTLSPELTLAQALDLAASCATRTELLVHGRLEMMLSAQCLLGGVLGGKEGPGRACSRPCDSGRFQLRDRLGLLFPLVPDRFCRLHVENSLDLSVLPELDRFARTGSDLRLELQGRGPDYARAVVRVYRRGLAAATAGAWTRSRGEEAEAGLAEYSPAGFTRGHFFRGVE